MKKLRLKKENGLAGTDAIIAVLIITLFTGLIATISYNIFLSNSSIKRMSKANSLIVDVFEFIDKSYYDDVTDENLTNFFNNDSKYNSEVIASNSENIKNETDHRYKIWIKIDKYNKDDDTRLDLVEEINVTVFYKLNGREQKISMKHTKSIESLKTPNAPNFSRLEEEEGYNIYPIKKINDTLIVCDRNDSTWYDYKYGRWAFAVGVESELNIGDEINIDDLEENDKLYAWIPRYAISTDEDEKDIIFLFGTSDKFIENSIDNNSIINTIDTETYEIPNIFITISGKDIDGIWKEDKADMVFDEELYLVYPYK